MEQAEDTNGHAVSVQHTHMQLKWFVCVIYRVWAWEAVTTVAEFNQSFAMAGHRSDDGNVGGEDAGDDTDGSVHPVLCIAVL